MSLIIDIRGVNGSGKSTMVRNWIMPDIAQQLISDRIPELVENTKEVFATCLTVKGEARVALGRYDKPSGGCDATKSQEQIRNRIRFFADLPFDVIVYEGVITATIVGAWGPFIKEMIDKGHDYVIGYLDTPLDTCRENIAKRRETSKIKRGPFNDALFVRKARSIAMTRPKFDALGIRTVDLRYGTPLEDQLFMRDQQVQGCYP